MKAQAIADGRYTGGERYLGYRIERVGGRKKLVVDETEQAFITFIQTSRDLKLREIRDEIDQRFSAECGASCNFMFRKAAIWERGDYVTLDV